MMRARSIVRGLGAVTIAAAVLVVAPVARPDRADAAPVVMTHQTPTTYLVTGTRDTGTGYYYLPGWSSYFKIAKSDTYKVNMTRVGSTGYTANVTSSGEDAGWVVTPELAPASGEVKTYVLYGSFMWSNSRTDRNFMSTVGGLTHWASGTGAVVEIRPTSTSAPTWSYTAGTTDSSVVAPSWSPANANTNGLRQVVVVVEDRRGGAAAWYVREYHELYRAHTIQRAYKVASGSGLSTNNKAYMYVPTGMWLYGATGSTAPLEPAVNTTSILFGSYASVVSTSTALADSIIAATAPNLATWAASAPDAADYGGAGWLDLPVYEESLPTSPTIDAEETSATVAGLSDADVPYALQWLWDKVLGWLGGLQDVFWFVPFFNDSAWG